MMGHKLWQLNYRDVIAGMFRRYILRAPLSELMIVFIISIRLYDPCCMEITGLMLKTDWADRFIVFHFLSEVNGKIEQMFSAFIIAGEETGELYILLKRFLRYFNYSWRSLSCIIVY